jgi:hypothetical protein
VLGVLALGFFLSLAIWEFSPGTVGTTDTMTDGEQTVPLLYPTLKTEEERVAVLTVPRLEANRGLFSSGSDWS